MLGWSDLPNSEVVVWVETWRWKSKPPRYLSTGSQKYKDLEAVIIVSKEQQVWSRGRVLGNEVRDGLGEKYINPCRTWWNFKWKTIGGFFFWQGSDTTGLFLRAVYVCVSMCEHVLCVCFNNDRNREKCGMLNNFVTAHVAIERHWRVLKAERTSNDWNLVVGTLLCRLLLLVKLDL